MILNIFSLFQDYGLALGSFVLLVIIGYYMMRNIIKRNREQEEKIDSLYGRLDKMVNKMSGDNINPDLVNFAENANRIQILLYHILRSYNADRVSVYEYHNGGHNLQGIEFKKTSNTYEAVELEIKPIIKEMQNLPISINPIWSKLLALKEPITIASVSTLDDDFFKAYLQAQGIKTYYSILLVAFDLSPIGFMSLEFFNSERELTEKEFDDFENMSIKISTLINIK
jgi:hypothetical protein